jgi:hypothetical protein
VPTLLPKNFGDQVPPGNAEEFMTVVGGLGKGGEPIATPSTTPIGTFRSARLDDEHDSDSEKSAGGFIPKCKSPSSGRVSPVPKLVLPKRVFKDHSPNGNRGRGNGLTIKDWAKDQTQFSHLPQLPDGWMRVRSKTTGGIYYCFIATGETTYEEPKGCGPPGTEANPDPSLPPGWHKMISRNTGKPYYWNSKLNQTQFDHPGESKNDESPAQDSKDEELPPGWAKMTSRRTGRPYYVNQELGISQFENPSEGAKSDGARSPSQRKSFRENGGSSTPTNGCSTPTNGGVSTPTRSGVLLDR